MVEVQATETGFRAVAELLEGAAARSSFCRVSFQQRHGELRAVDGRFAGASKARQACSYD